MLKGLILLLCCQIVLSYEMVIYLVPHVLPEWNEDNYKIWGSWKSVLELVDIVLKEQEITYVVPSFYFDIFVDSNNTTFYELMQDKNLVIMDTSPDVEVLKNTIEPYLSTSNLTPKRSLGLLFQKTSSGECLGGFSNDELQNLKNVDESLQQYTNYGGMDVLDFTLFDLFQTTHDSIDYYPHLRTIYFNYFDTFSSTYIDTAIDFCKRFNTTLTIDISDMGSQFFVGCSQFKEILSNIKDNGVDYKLLINRSLWISEWTVILNFLVQDCLSEID
ncbi:Uncharacterized protein QTN25_006443 [Entamoeba marina]